MPLLRTPAELSALTRRPRRLLAVFAHPDDEAYGCAGAFARYGPREDTACVLLTLTRGEASSIGAQRGLSPAEVGELRTRRLERVAEIVRLDGLLVRDLPDGRLARLPVREVAAPVAEALRALRPHVLVTHDARGVNGHPDHVAAHWAVRRALEDAPDVLLAMLAYDQEVSDRARPRVLFATADEEVDCRLTLSEEEIDKKEACLRVHEAVVTLRGGGDGELLRRPPVELYDFLGRDCSPPWHDLFGRAGGGAVGGR